MKKISLGMIALAADAKAILSNADKFLEEYKPQKNQTDFRLNG